MMLLSRGGADITLLGDLAKQQGLKDSLGLELDEKEMVDPRSSELRDDFAKMYVEVRSHKGLTDQMANDPITEVS